MAEVNEEVKLLGAWFSPYLLRPKIALKLKSVEFDYIEENLFGAKSELLLKSNPVHKKVPVLIHNGKSICESQIIVEYIDEFWKSSEPSLLPSDTYDRAIARFWASYIDEKLLPSVKAAAIAKSEEAKESAMKEAEEGLALLEEAFISCSKGKPFFGGERIGFLDITLGSFVVLLNAREKLKGEKVLDDSKTPCLCKWAKDFCSDASVKSVLPDTDKLVEFLDDLETRANAAAAPPPK